MKIAESSIQMAASHASVSKREVQESLRMWVGDRRPDFEARRSEGHREARHGGEGLRVSLSDRARMARIEPPTPEPAKDSEQDEILDSAMSMLRALTEMFTGRPVKIFDPRELEPGHRHGRGRGESTGTEQAAAPQRAGFGIE